MAIYIALLDLYQALFERSCDAVMAFTEALHNFYKRRGFVHCNGKVRMLKCVVGWFLTLALREMRSTTLGDDLLHKRFSGKITCKQMSTRLLMIY
jgi:hypothetical protein